jgi:hypothetical protein
MHISCPKCGNQGDAAERFCRKCGADLEGALARSSGQPVLKMPVAEAPSRDPDELTGSGVANFFIGDGFLIVAILLSVMDSSVKSLLWLLFLIPTLFFYGKGFADLFKARQIRRRLKQDELNAASKTVELPPARRTVLDGFRNHQSGELISTQSVTERTTRQLK